MPSAPLPRVSVCLLTYKRAHALAWTLDSLLAQSHADFELIINDNHSPDHTEEVCREYERRDSRVRYYKNPVNIFYAGNQNAAMLRSSAEYVALVHDGDIYRPDLLETWTRVLQSEPSAALVFNALEQMDRQGRVVGTSRHTYGQLIRGIDLFDEMIRMPHSPIFGIAMVRKSCVMSVGPFDPRIPTLADVDMWMRLLLRHDAAYTPEILFKTFAREPGHAASVPNWRVRAEHELIYGLNSARRYPGQPDKVRQLRNQIAPMLWRIRVLMWLGAARRGQIKVAAEGLQFMAQHVDFAATAIPDSVLDWEGVAQQLRARP